MYVYFEFTLYPILVEHKIKQNNKLNCGSIKDEQGINYIC